ncbi:MAG: SPOR domain-containing protein [Neisseriaceae bacterium]
MKDFGKKIMSVIVGMLLATFSIGALLWFVNRYMFSRPPVQTDAPNSTVIQPQKAESTNSDSLAELTNLGGFDSSKTTSTSEETNEFQIESEPRDSSSVSETSSANPAAKSAATKVSPSEQASSSSDHNPQQRGAVGHSIRSPIHLGIGSSVTPVKHAGQSPTPPISKDRIGSLIKELDRHKASSLTSTRSYQIQMGAYRDPKEADRQRAHLLILNVSAQVIKVKVNGQDYYRVISAKPLTKEQALQIQSALRAQRIDSIVLSR